MLTTIESESNAWTVIAADGELRIYGRDESGEWSELSLSESSDDLDSDKGLMLEELYLQRAEDENGDEPENFEGDEEEDEEGEEEPELAEASEEDEEGEDEEPEEEAPKPRRRSRASAKRG